VRFETIQADIAGYENRYLSGFDYVEMYTGKGLPEGKKSFLFRFSIGSSERTLLSEDINEFSEGLLKHMEKKGYSLR
jgi:phenylalanyl-tRNA synthetase beta chain